MRSALPMLLAGLLLPAKAPADEPPGVERRLAAMGTSLSLRVSARTREVALEASEAAVREIARVEGLLSTWREDGALALLDASPVGRDVSVDGELLSTLAGVLGWSRRTGGAFDPTVLPLVRAFDLRGRGRIPTAAERRAARSAIGPQAFTLDPAAGTVRRNGPLSGFDEGAWGKGYALDRAAGALRAAGATAALLDLGGQALALGDGSFPVGIAHPRERGRAIATLDLTAGSLATSGNSERGLDVAGRRLGHLLDPRTGEPAMDFGSVTVLAPSALVADILSTALFVLGPDEGLALSSRLRSEGVENEALFLVVSDRTLRRRATPGMARALANHCRGAPTPPPAPRRGSR